MGEKTYVFLKENARVARKPTFSRGNTDMLLGNLRFPEGISHKLILRSSALLEWPRHDALGRMRGRGSEGQGLVALAQADVTATSS